MAQINKPSDYFSVDLWDGNSSTQSINVGKDFSNNGSLIWIKGRNHSSFAHRFIDSVRGKDKLLSSSSSDAEFTESGDGIASYSSTGFNLQYSAQNDYNETNGDYVGWNWLAGSTTSSNTDGSITSSVSANTTAGFSIVSYTGTGANATVGHGLSATPKMIIIKRRDANDSWWVYNEAIGNGAYLVLNSGNASQTTGASGLWNNTSPTSSVFSVGDNTGLNGSGASLIAYCFAEKKGFSKFGKYVGNNSNDGVFIYTGFKPAFVMTKSTTTGEAWNIMDNKRAYTFNPTGYFVYANNNNVEISNTTYSETDFLSNGFKLRSSHGQYNGTATHIYMTFAEQPLVGTNNIPCTAR